MSISRTSKKVVELGEGNCEWGSGFKYLGTPKGAFEGNYQNTKPRSGLTGLKPGRRYRLYAVDIGEAKEEPTAD